MIEHYVNWRKSVALTGSVIKWLSVAMVIPLAISIIYGEPVWVFIASALIFAAVGRSLEFLETDTDLGAREAILLVTLAWASVSIIGTVPYLLAGLDSASTLS
ncbi:MAG: TrkH family potassium uptake protein, partial [Salinirussus sp.]